MENLSDNGGDRMREIRAQSDQDRLRSSPSRYYKDVSQTDTAKKQFPESGVNRDQTNLHSQRGPEGYRRSDERIREIITDMIQTDPAIDSRDLDIKVHEGRVRLTGYIPDADAEKRISAVIQRVPGIKEIESELKINEHAKGDNS